jgi:hypothetical protein
MSPRRQSVGPFSKALVGAVAAFLLVSSTAVGFASAQEETVVVYDSVGPDLLPNYPSQPFQAEQVNEFGDMVTLAAGPRELAKVSVVVSSQACESGSGTAQCTTSTATPTPTFTIPMTLKVYNAAGTTATPTVGSEIASVTRDVTLPHRPSADPDCTGSEAGFWQDELDDCYSGVAVVVDFEFPSGTTVPDTLIWAISYNSETAGYNPTGTDGHHDFVNVATQSLPGQPSVGTDVDEDIAFISSNTTNDEQIVTIDGQTGVRTLARIEVVAPVEETTTTVETTIPTDTTDSVPASATTGAPLSFAG